MVAIIGVAVSPENQLGTGQKKQKLKGVVGQKKETFSSRQTEVIHRCK